MQPLDRRQLKVMLPDQPSMFGADIEGVTAWIFLAGIVTAGALGSVSGF